MFVKIMMKLKLLWEEKNMTVVEAQTNAKLLVKGPIRHLKEL